MDADRKMTLSVCAKGSGELAPLLIDAIHEYGEGKLCGFMEYEPNLEEIFLAATKRSWEEIMKTSKVRASNVEHKNVER